MNEWDGFNFNPFKTAALSAMRRIASSFRGNTTTPTDGLIQPTTPPPAAASLGEGLFQEH